MKSREEVLAEVEALMKDAMRRLEREVPIAQRLILSLLRVKGPLHGNEIIEKIEKRCERRGKCIDPLDNTLPVMVALGSLVEAGLVEWEYWADTDDVDADEWFPFFRADKGRYSLGMIEDERGEERAK
jgi:hypothetical protein